MHLSLFQFQLQFHFESEHYSVVLDALDKHNKIIAFDVDTGVDMVLDVMDKEDQVKQQRRIIIWGVFCTLVTHKLRMVLWDTSVTPNMQSLTERKKLAKNSGT